MAPIERGNVNWQALMTWDRGWRERCAKVEAEVERLRAENERLWGELRKLSAPGPRGVWGTGA